MIKHILVAHKMRKRLSPMHEREEKMRLVKFDLNKAPSPRPLLSESECVRKKRLVSWEDLVPHSWLRRCPPVAAMVEVT